MRSHDSQRPLCGQCGYDLTGSEGNRCPECGLLFIEAGVTFQRDKGARGRQLRRNVILALVVLLGAGAAMSTMAYLRARAARERAIAQQQAAIAQQQAVLQVLQENLTTTHPIPNVVDQESDGGQRSGDAD